MTRKLRFALARRCAALLALSLLLRVLPHWDRQLFLRSDKPFSAESIQSAPSAESAPTAEPRRGLPPLRFRDVPEEAAEEIALPSADPLPDFSAADADALSVHGNCTLSYDRAALLSAPLPAAAADGGPQVLIVQTHSTEAYTPSPGCLYEETEPYRTLDPAHSVIRVGAEIAAALESRGIAVLHDQTVNDYPSYAGSYDRMAAIIQEYLAAYPSIRMVLDVHRDAFALEDGSMGGTAEDGRAMVMLVCGTDEGGLYHPQWKQNLSLALKLEQLLQTDCPGMSRGIALVTQRYNQHLTPLSLLAEFGTAGDTLEEALAAARDFAEQLSRLLG